MHELSDKGVYQILLLAILAFVAVPAGRRDEKLNSGLDVLLACEPDKHRVCDSLRGVLGGEGGCGASGCMSVCTCRCVRL